MTRAARLAFLLLLAAPAARADLAQPINNARYPTAGILPHRAYRVEARLTPESSVQGGARLGLWNRVQIGAFYGVQHIVEKGDPIFNDHAGFEVRARVLEEDRWPALVVGFDSQGWYQYHPGDRRYERKSPGFFAVASKNWRSFAGDLSLHLGADYSLEREDEDAPNLFAAADWTIARTVSLLFDAGTAWNDDTDDGRYGLGGVYLDAGVRVALGEHLQMMLVFSDLTRNLAPGSDVGREVEIVYLNGF